MLYQNIYRVDHNHMHISRKSNRKSWKKNKGKQEILELTAYFLRKIMKIVIIGIASEANDLDC